MPSHIHPTSKTARSCLSATDSNHHLLDVIRRLGQRGRLWPGPPSSPRCLIMHAWRRPGHRNGRQRLGFVMTLALHTFLASSSSRICCLAALCLAARARSAHARYLALSWARAARCFALCFSKTVMARRHRSREGADLGAMLVGTVRAHERLRSHTVHATQVPA